MIHHRIATHFEPSPAGVKSSAQLSGVGGPYDLPMAGLHWHVRHRWITDGSPMGFPPGVHWEKHHI